MQRGAAPRVERTGVRRFLPIVVASALLAGAFVPGAQAAIPTDHGCEWLAGDFHVHTVYSHDSFGGPLYDDEPQKEAQSPYTLGWTVAEEGAIAKSRGLDFLTITDHNNVRSQTDPGWALAGSTGLTMVPGYENSIGGHAQMIGATKVYDNSVGVPAVADQLRADGGVFQINHPADGKWEDSAGNYLFPGFVPDTVEIWNIGVWAYEPPLPATEDHEYPPHFYDRFLDSGAHVAATGGSDSHWRSTTAAQGPGQPTTWVCAAENTVPAILAGLKAGRTTIANEPPAYHGPFATLSADSDGNGTFDSNLGDTVVPGSTVRATVDGAPGAVLRLITNGSTVLEEVPVDSPNFSYTFDVPASSTWVRAEVYYTDAGAERQQLKFACDVVGSGTGQLDSGYSDVAYCRTRLAVVAMTSAIYFQAPDFDPSTTLTYNGDRTMRVGGAATLSAILTDSGRAPIAGAPVTFGFRGQTYQATTNDTGVAAVRVKVLGPPGSYDVTSGFGGSETYLPSQDRDTVLATGGSSRG
jgi:hypothetical protein